MSTANSSPTRIRYLVLLMLCFLAMITYLDRAVNGNANEDIMNSVGREKADYKYVLMAFQIAYALFEIPTGWMGDVKGPRTTLLRVVIWWSTFVALTGFTGKIEGLETVYITFTGLIIIQFLFGMGEAGAFPNIARALYNWFPASERGFAQGAIWLSARMMGGLTPVVWVLMVGIGPFNWREALWIFAGIAFVWCVVFAWFFRNRPSEHWMVNEEEKKIIDHGRVDSGAAHAGVPWKKIMLNRNVRYLCLMYFCLNFGWYFVMYFLPGVLKEKFGGQIEGNMGKILIGLLAGSPLLFGMFGCLLGGVLTDRYVRKTGDRKWGRRLYSMLGFGLCGLSYLTALVFQENLILFAMFVGMAGFFNDMTMGSAWATCQDVGRKYSAIISGSMNMIGNLGGAVTSYFTGTMLDKNNPVENGMAICLIAYACAYFIGMLAWLRIDASKPIEETD